MRYLQSISFFEHICNTFGATTVKLLKEWIRHRQCIYKNKLRIRFLKTCVLREITPPHLFGLQRFEIHLQDNTLRSKFDDIKNSLTKRLLRIETNDAYRGIDYSLNRLFRLARNIMKILPLKLAHNFFHNHERRLFSLFIKEQQRIDNKLKWLTLKQNKIENKDIKCIKYYWSSNGFSPNECSTLSPTERKKYSMHNPPTFYEKNSQVLEISITPPSPSDKLDHLKITSELFKVNI